MKKDKFLIPDGPFCYSGEPGKSNFKPCPYWKVYSEDEFCRCEHLPDEEDETSMSLKVKCCFINIEYEYDE